VVSFAVVRTVVVVSAPQLNGLCRGYTPKFRADQKEMQKATKAKDWKAFGYALGHYLALALAQERQIERPRSLPRCAHR
jgi:hypothetical protein